MDNINLPIEVKQFKDKLNAKGIEINIIEISQYENIYEVKYSASEKISKIVYIRKEHNRMSDSDIGKTK